MSLNHIQEKKTPKPDEYKECNKLDFKQRIDSPYTYINNYNKMAEEIQFYEITLN